MAAAESDKDSGYSGLALPFICVCYLAQALLLLVMIGKSDSSPL